MAKADNTIKCEYCGRETSALPELVILLTPHQLRHFFATYQIHDGADIKAVSKMLGHASVATTLNIYHHVDREEIKRVHDEHSPLNIGGNDA